MPQLKLAITTSVKNYTNLKRQLTLSIQKKRLELKKIVVKVEALKVNLEITKQEYMVRVGSLFVKDNQLDLEIISSNNILNLMNKGMSYKEASQYISKTYYAQQLDLEKEKQDIKYDEEIYNKRGDTSNSTYADLKKLWIRLISKFHPDLVQDLSIKKRHDQIMKHINIAFQEGDYDRLVRIENDNISYHENTTDNLETILVNIINEISQKEEEYKSLKKSEWSTWMEKIKKAKEKNINLFEDTERRLLNDIAVKISELNTLKQKISNKQNT